MIAHYKGNIPFVDISQMREIDRIANEELGIGHIQMMENAGLNLALLAKEKFLHNEPKKKKVQIIAGTGLNGKTALVAARRLKSWGVEVSVILAVEQSKYTKEYQQQLDSLKKLGIKFKEKPEKSNLIIDGIVGYGLNGGLSKKAAELIMEINRLGSPVLALDAPSGLDLNNGKPSDPTIKANATLTLAMPKTGLFKLNASKYIGELYLADIGIPPMAFQKFHIRETDLEGIFKEGTLVKINKVIVFS
ncbi:MAG: NAD(P)H-hydrate epimerase [Bacteroidales bacterium]|nr:NAD(P)H-hydrate epimerase [Bacteroidales bacterium]